MQVVCYKTDILLMDVVGFSCLPNEKQLATAMVITEKLKETIGLLVNQALLDQPEVVLGFVPTGDGFYVILQPEFAGYGVFLAASLRSSLLLASKKSGVLFAGIRTAVHLGDALPFVDITTKRNFVGHGLNECAQFLEATPQQSPTEGIPEDSNYLIVSEPAWAWFGKAYPASEQMEEFFGTIKFRWSESFMVVGKHGREHEVRFVECSRHMAIKPPAPADIDQRVERFLSRIRELKSNQAIKTDP